VQVGQSSGLSHLFNSHDKALRPREESLLLNVRIAFVIHRLGWLLVGGIMFCGFRDLGFWEGLVGSTLVILGILVHELAHVIAAMILKVPVYEVGISFVGAYTRRKHASCRLHEAAIASAGPIASLALVIILFFVPVIGSWLAAWNLAIAVLNMIPFPGTDGHRIVSSIFCPSIFGIPKPVQAPSQVE
jgi:Zn-dependent protease